MSIWFLLNGLLLIWAIWNVASGVAVHTSYIHILLGFTASCSSSSIGPATRSSPQSGTSKTGRRRSGSPQCPSGSGPYHRWVGTGALLIILLHAWAVVALYGFNLGNMKILTGFLASINLFVLVLSGWYRLLVDPRIKIRKLHIRLGVSMFILTAVHFIY